MVKLACLKCGGLWDKPCLGQTKDYSRYLLLLCYAHNIKCGGSWDKPCLGQTKDYSRYLLLLCYAHNIKASKSKV